MNLIAYRIYHDTGLAILVCKIIRHHDWVDASYRDQACSRCPGTFRTKPGR